MKTLKSGHEAAFFVPFVVYGKKRPQGNQWEDRFSVESLEGNRLTPEQTSAWCDTTLECQRGLTELGRGILRRIEFPTGSLYFVSNLHGGERIRRTANAELSRSVNEETRMDQQRLTGKTIIVIPCYNEAIRLEREEFKVYSRSNPEVDFLFVDDGSTDDTYSVLKSLCEAEPRMTVHRLAQNSGKAEAVRQGVLQALNREADFVAFWDADLATPLSSINDFLKVYRQHPHLALVMGARVKLLGRDIQRIALRHYLGRVFATVVSTMLSLPVYDTQCGAKMFRASDEARKIFSDPFLTKWIFDVELIARMIAFRKQHSRPPVEQAIYEYPLETWRDVRGSKVKPKDYFKALGDTWTIYKTYLSPLKR